MKRILVVLLIVWGTGFLFNFVKNSNAQSRISSCQCITDALSDIEKIKAGMKRKDLNVLFSLDGGMSPINPQRFVYGKCSSIKVEVKFDFIDKRNRVPKDNPEDEIIGISKPYLEHPFYD